MCKNLSICGKYNYNIYVNYSFSKHEEKYKKDKKYSD